MTQSIFYDTVKKDFQEKYPDASVEIVDTEKEGGVKHKALCIKRDGSNVSPLIYLEGYYSKIAKGVPYGTVIDSIKSRYIETVGNGKLQEIIVNTMNYECARPMLRARLMNPKGNENLLKDIPHIPYLDMAITFVLKIQAPGIPEGTIKVTNSMLKSWAAGIQEVYGEAMENTMALEKPIIQEMDSFMKSINPSHEDMLGEFAPMYILTNESHIHGAIEMLVIPQLRKLATQCGSDLWIMPSSIHEVIIVPDSSKMDKSELDEIVRHANRTTVHPSEQLSDHVYKYLRNEEKIIYKYEDFIDECEVTG